MVFFRSCLLPNALQRLRSFLPIVASVCLLAGTVGCETTKGSAPNKLSEVDKKKAAERAAEKIEKTPSAPQEQMPDFDPDEYLRKQGFSASTIAMIKEAEAADIEDTYQKTCLLVEKRKWEFVTNPYTLRRKPKASTLNLFTYNCDSISRLKLELEEMKRKRAMGM